MHEKGEVKANSLKKILRRDEYLTITSSIVIRFSRFVNYILAQKNIDVQVRRSVQVNKYSSYFVFQVSRLKDVINTFIDYHRIIAYNL